MENSFIGRFYNRSVVRTAIFAVIFLLSLTAYLLPAKAATGNATVTAQPADVEFRPAVGHKSAAVFAVVKFGLKDADAVSDDTLDSVAVTVIAGSPAITAADFASLSVYKDNGDGIFSAGTDTLLGTQTTVNVGSATTITTGTNALSGSASATTYFVVGTLAASPTEGRKFKMDVATNGITVTGSAITTTALTGTTSHVVDNTAPVLNTASTFPKNGDTNVPLGSFFNANFTDASDMDPTTINPANITFTRSASAVPFSLKRFPNGFDLVPSGGAPAWAASTRWSKPWSPTNCFANFQHNIAVGFDCNATFAAGDIVLFQHENMPAEIGIVTNATKTGGTFAVNNFPLYGPQRVIKIATPNATGVVTGTTSISTGDILLVSSSANPDTSSNNWDTYGWAIATAGAAVNNADLRLASVSGVGSAAPTFSTGSSFSAITPSATATDNGATNGGTLAVSVGDMVYAQLTGATGYGWHIVTGAGDMSSDSTEGTATVDGKTAANSRVAANTQMSKLTPVAQGAVTDSTVLSDGDIVFGHATAGALGNLSGYDFHFASLGAAINSAALRLDNAPANLLPNSTYVVTIGTGLKDLAGNALAATSTISFSTSSNDPTNVKLPPAIESTAPSSGSASFSPNGNLYIQFTAGDSGNMLADGTANAINNANNVLLQAAALGSPSGSALAATLTWDATNKLLKIDPAANLAANQAHVLTIKKNVVNVAGLGFGGTGTADYILFFTTGATADVTAPTVTSVDPKTNATGVARNIPSIFAQFSEAIDPTTLTASNIIFWKDSDASGTLNGAETAITANLKYNPTSFGANVGLQMLLDQNTKYCVKATTGVKDVTGNAFASDATSCFTTVDAAFTATAPTVMFADADTYRMWIEFDQSVDFTGGPFGAINKQNYTVENPIGTKIDLNSATFSARPEARAVEVTGLSFQPNTEFKVTVKNVKESSGSLSIVPGAGDFGRGTVFDASKGGTFGGFDMPTFDQKNFGNFWTSPERCDPYNRLPEQTGKFRCEFPAPAALTTGAQVIFTFPTGFDLTNANVVPATESWDNKDVNGWGPGTTTITATSTNAAARTFTVTLTHTGSVMLPGDQLMFELKGIKNPATAGEKSVTAIVKDANGTKVGQTVNFAPFDILTAGSRTISGTVCKSSTSGGACAEGDTGIAGVTVFLDSFMGMGRFETKTDANGDYSFGSLNNGDYGVMLSFGQDATALGNLGGGGQFKQVNISNSNKTDIDFKMVDLSTTGKTLTVNVTGGPAATDFDVFCSAGGFDFQFSAPIVKKGTTDGSGAAAVTIKLQPNTTYQCSVGPHIAFESFNNGGPPPVPIFTFMPPPPKTVAVASADLSIAFALKTTDQEIKIKVTDGATGIANVYVDAFPIGGKGVDSSTGALVEMMGSFAQTKSDGTAVLKITTGTYRVTACSPGMPCSGDNVVDVKANSSNTDGNTAADVYKDGTLLTGDGLTIKLAKSGVTIAGQLQDENGNSLKYGFVDAQRVTSGDTCSNFTPTGGFAGSPTDSNGNYTVYMPPGYESGATTWRLAGFAPAYGEVGCKIITMSGTSKTGQNIAVTAADFGKVKITATKGGTAVEGAFVGCYGPNGGNHGKTGTDGTVTLTMKTGTYTCDGNLPGAGPLAQQTGVAVTSGATTDTTLAVGNPGTVTVILGATVTSAFCSAVDSSGRGAFAKYEGSSLSLKVPAGTYNVQCNNEGIGQIFSSSTVVTAGQTNSIDKTSVVPTLYTVTGEIEDSTGTNIQGATVVFSDQSNGRKSFVTTSGATGANTNVSVSLPAGTYSVQSLKSGFTDNTNSTGRPETLVVSADTTLTKRSLAQNSADNVSITVKEGSSTTNYGGEAKVIATRASDGKVIFDDIDRTATSTANASMSLPAGTWTVEVKSDDGRQDGTPATVVVAANNIANSSPTLNIDTSIPGFSSATTTKKSFIPSVGGTIIDDNIAGLAVELDVTDANDSTSGTLEMKKAPQIAFSTSESKVVGTTGYSITPTNSSGKEVHDATGIVKLPITTADLATAGFATSTAAQILAAGDKVRISKLNDLGAWEDLATTFVKDANGTDKHLLIAKTDSFSDFAPTVAAADAPSTPTGLTATVISGSQINLAWTKSSGATGYNIYRTTNNSLAIADFPRVGSDPTVGDVSTYSNTGLNSGTTYYYTLSALNNSGESAAITTKVSAKTNSGGGGGGGLITGPVIVAPAATIPTEVAAKVAQADMATGAIDSSKADIASVASTSANKYGSMSVTDLTAEVTKVVKAISELAKGNAITAEVKSSAQAAVKNLLIGLIQATIKKIQLRLSELMTVY